MRNRLTTLFFASFFVFSMVVSSGCMVHTHVVGNGAQTGNLEEARQWYILWGLVPINDVDTNNMAAGADDYTIETETTPIDFLIGLVAGIITVNSRTVTVTR